MRHCIIYLFHWSTVLALAEGMVKPVKNGVVWINHVIFIKQYYWTNVLASPGNLTVILLETIYLTHLPKVQHWYFYPIGYKISKLSVILSLCFRLLFSDLKLILLFHPGQNSTNYTWLEAPLYSSSNATKNITSKWN